jgi:hypothetical protein
MRSHATQGVLTLTFPWVVICQLPIEGVGLAAGIASNMSGPSSRGYDRFHGILSEFVSMFVCLFVWWGE